MVMLTDAVRLLLFPALMAFAASSDLFTMTISNRVTLILVAGFFGLALYSGMDLHAVLWHVTAAFAVLAVTFEHDHIVPPASATALLDGVASPDKAQLHLSGGHVGAVVSRKAASGLWPQLSRWWAVRDTDEARGLADDDDVTDRSSAAPPEPPAHTAPPRT